MTTRPGGSADPEPCRTVVAVVVEWRGRIGLFRRSRFVHHDRGRWHCVTGYLEPRQSPEQQALLELFEETGLRAADLLQWCSGRVLRITDDSGRVWSVHTFRAVTLRRRLALDREHDAYRWVAPHRVARFTNRVTWLDGVLLAVGDAPDARPLTTDAAAAAHRL